MDFEAKINAVDWAALHHAYGPAEDVPDLLRALMWPEQANAALRAAANAKSVRVFDHVAWTLWGNVFHQGTVWQATAATVPLFVEILKSGPEDAKLKAFLITYLHHLAAGYPDDMFPDGVDPDQDFAEVAGLEEPGGAPDYGADDNRWLIWKRDSYEAVEKHVPDVLPFVNHPDDSVAEEAIAFCATFPRQAEIMAPALHAIAASADRRGAMAALSLAAVNDAEAPTLAAPMAMSDDLLTSVLGGCAVAIYDPERVTPEAVAAMTKPLDEIGEVPLAHAGTVRALVGRCLVWLGPDHRETAVAQICDQMQQAKPMEKLTLTGSLLQIAFPDMPAPEKAADLSDLQRKAMETIRDHGAFRVANGIFANYASVLQAWNLPSSAEDIDRWLKPSSSWWRR